MSFRVLVIPEDPTNNGYILRPLVEKMLAEIGKPQAHIQVLPNPRLQGYDCAVRAIRGELVDRYKHWDLWLFLPDADRAANLDDLERALAPKGVRLRCCAARPEVEAWLLAGHRHCLPMKWSSIPTHARLKEEVFEPFMAKYGDRSPGQGREALMKETLSNYRSLLEMCPELKQLEARLRELLA